MTWNLSGVKIFSVMKILGVKGWRLQPPGMTFLNGALAVNLMKDGQVLLLSQKLTPDQERTEQDWPQGPRPVPRF